MPIIRPGTIVIAHSTCDPRYEKRCGRVIGTAKTKYSPGASHRWALVDFGKESVIQGEIPERYVSSPISSLERNDKVLRNQ